MSQPAPRDVDAFINGAPDARQTQPAAPADGPKRVMKGKQVQISHAMPPELLDELDKFVARNPGLKRSPAINIAIRQMLRQGIVLNLLPVDEEGQP